MSKYEGVGGPVDAYEFSFTRESSVDLDGDTEAVVDLEATKEHDFSVDDTVRWNGHTTRMSVSAPKAA